jgi:hypothetical protein
MRVKAPVKLSLRVALISGIYMFFRRCSGRGFTAATRASRSERMSDSRSNRRLVTGAITELQYGEA